MKRDTYQLERKSAQRAMLVIVAVGMNIILSFGVFYTGLPLFLDTAGTILVALSMGMVPGIVAAVLTNAVCVLFNENDLYFTCINAFIAIFTAWYARKYTLRKIGRTLFYILSIAIISGILSAVIQWSILGHPQHEVVIDYTQALAISFGIGKPQAFLIMNLLLNLLDKGAATVVAVGIYHVIGKKKMEAIRQGGWRQKPLSDEEAKAIRKWSSDVKHSIRKRTVLLVLGGALIIVILMGWSGVKLYFEHDKAEKVEIAEKTIQFAEDVIDVERVDEFMRKGGADDNYAKVKEMLVKIEENAVAVNKLSVVRMEEDGYRFIFDVGESQNDYGNFYSYDERLKPYREKLLAGESINPIESGRLQDWEMTIYKPVYNATGSCVCYVIVKMQMANVAAFISEYALREVLILSGFFILILGYGLWTASRYLIYPISGMAACLDGLVQREEMQEKLDENVKTFRNLNIRTGDEVEKLFESICQTTLNQAEQMRNIRRLSHQTEQMQDGLIITMADMVENRDSDTGAHIQKTAAYVKIIVESLWKKGYYAEKLSPKYISDVIRSAPLHDVGKIRIADEILNKPGKLTEEEFEIMKTHTTAGKQIMESAISTVQGENYLKEARNMAAYHHEHWDGTGYPEGLHGEVIPLSARIMAVADVFDALTSERVYKPPFTMEEALNILKEQSGKQFDPKCVEAFIDSLAEVRVIFKKYNQQP